MKKKALVVLLLVVMLVGTFATFSYGADKKTGLYKEDGQWKYFENGTFKAATGLVQRPDNKTWHYVENGIYNKATGLVQCVQPGGSKGKWYYVVKGDLDNTATGLVQCVQPGSSKGRWYYVNNGKLNNSATGLVQCVQPGSSNGKWYYVENGKLNDKASGLVKCIQPNSSSKGKWYYVRKGKQNNVTGIVSCIQPGDPSQYKDYYVENGKPKKVTKLYTGTIYSHGRMTLEDGTILYHNYKKDGTFYVKDGKFTTCRGVREINGKKICLYAGEYLENAKGFIVEDNNKYLNDITSYTIYMTENGKVKNYTGTVYATLDYSFSQEKRIIKLDVKNGKAVVPATEPKNTKGSPYWRDEEDIKLWCIEERVEDDNGLRIYYIYTTTCPLVNNWVNMD